MSRKKRTARSLENQGSKNLANDESLFREVLEFVLPEGALFSKEEFHGNIKWVPEQLAAQGLIWSWQESKSVTDAFDKTLEICQRMNLTKGSKTYTGFMNAIGHYRPIIGERLRSRLQELAKEVGGRLLCSQLWPRPRSQVRQEEVQGTSAQA